MPMPQGQPQYGMPPAGSMGGQPQQGQGSGMMMPPMGMPQTGMPMPQGQPQYGMPPAGPMGGQPQQEQKSGMMMPPMGMPQGVAMKPGGESHGQAGSTFPAQVMPAFNGPYGSPGTPQPPAASLGTQPFTPPDPGNAPPPMAPWQFGPAPQLQGAEQQAPGTEPGRKP